MTILRNTMGKKFREIKAPNYHMVLISNYHMKIQLKQCINKLEYLNIMVDLNYLRPGVIKFYLFLIQKFTEIP